MQKSNRSSAARGDWGDVTEFINVRAPRSSAAAGMNGGCSIGDLENACVVLPVRFFYPLANTECVDVLDVAAVDQLTLQLRGQQTEWVCGRTIVEGASQEGRPFHREEMSTTRCSGVFAAHLWARSWCASGQKRHLGKTATPDNVARAGACDTIASITVTVPGAPSDHQGVNGSEPSGKVSNSDVIWLANLALRNKK